MLPCFLLADCFDESLLPDAPSSAAAHYKVELTKRWHVTVRCS